MEWLSGILGGAGWLAFGIIALRFSGLKHDRDQADLARNEQAKELKGMTEAYKDYRQRMQARLEDLENEIEQLEQHIAESDGPGDRLTTLNRLLQKASGARRDAEDGLRQDPTPG